ncbi:MAG: DNA (cytosine-5-)-methyltransferase [Eubacteriales bacterium]|nr:DNA (cytosine-5-)-methyltransferase [Eubacteriales bacterium]
MSIGAVDLFCGVGGLTCGLQSAGIKVVAGIDLDSSCKYAYEHSNDTTFINKSIEKVTGKDIKKLLKGYDTKILVGCAPCQPFSNHQKDKGNRQKHKDWSLLYQFARIVEESKPHIVSMENVPELKKEKVFTDFVSKLTELGYYVSYSVVNAADYGVAQRRRRLILLASKKKKISIIAPTHKNNYVTVKQIIYNLPRIKAGEVCQTDILHRAPSLSKKNMQRIRASIPNGTWRDWPEELVLPCHKKKGGATYSSVYGRMSWKGLAPTITTQFICYGTGRFGHPEQDRAISLREGALIQSFPANYVFYDPSTEFNQRSIAKHIGNAVPPRLGEIVGESIILSLPKKRKDKKHV